VPVSGGPFDGALLKGIEETFGREHQRTYGHKAGDDEPVEIVSLRVVGAGVPDRPRVPEALRVDRTGPGRAGGSRRVFFGPELGWRETPIIDRPDLATRREGPCIVEEYDATCVIPPGAHATLDAHGNIVIELAEEI
jgi:N-methylhydantoinase A